MNKKTFLTSLLTIAMCLALIAGSTYALFTSEVRTAKVAARSAFDGTTIGANTVENVTLQNN